jgi:aminopeptidase
MARGGGKGGISNLAGPGDTPTFESAVAFGDRVLVYAHPADRVQALESVEQAYEAGALWVDVVYATAADNAYSTDRERDHETVLRVAHVEHPEGVWNEEQRTRYASSILDSALRIGTGDKLVIDALPQHAHVVEQVVLGAYERGAVTVDVNYQDPETALVRARSAETFERAPDDWMRDRIDMAMADGACYLSISDNEHTGVADAAHQQRQRAEQATRRYDTHDTYYAMQRANQVRWCIAEAPTEQWAQRVYPELDAQQALARLGQDLLDFAHVGPDDDEGSYERHVQRLRERSAWLNEQHLDGIVIEDEQGNELHVPLLHGSRFLPCDWDTQQGDRFACNVPSSEIFTSPDPHAVTGRMRTTRPVMLSGRQVDEIVLDFEDGRAQLVSCQPESMATLLQAYLRADDGSSRLGEVGIVADSRMGERNRLFYNGIIDENACSHVALGYGYDAALDPQASEPAANNQSQLHVDLMVGGPGVRVWGVRDGQRVGIVDGANWLGGRIES